MRPVESPLTQEARMQPNEAASARICVTCGEPSPETETNYTLISAAYGWRLSRTLDDQGQVKMEWRCPKCWAVYRRKGARSA